ncbi:MAG: hypothetical protein M0R37_15315 [Bacteroidales bacterium]|jgi:hypothetical protein|nr:hypothetical protein [Bacteroidales bacterium]
MTRQFTTRVDAIYPATVADYRKAKAGRLDDVTWATAEAGETLAAPYPEIVGSWLANGFEEVTGDDHAGE